MAIINAAIQEQVRAALADLDEPVKVIVFTQAAECDYCAETRQLAEEVAAFSDKITVEARDLAADAEVAQAYAVDKAPAMVIARAAAPPTHAGIRLYGIPAGYEFATFIEAIRLVSRGEAGLSPASLSVLKRLEQPLRIQVFVTPSCPHCPQAAQLAHRLAQASDLITADMVEAEEFPELADRYHVYGVPRTVINDTIHIEGAMPEAAVVARLAAMLDERQGVPRPGGLEPVM